MSGFGYITEVSAALHKPVRDHWHLLYSVLHFWNPLLAPSRKPQNPNVLSFPGTGFTKPHNLIDPKPKTLLPEGAILDSSKIPGIVRVRAEHRAFDDRRVLYGPLLLWSGFRV